MNNYYIHYDSKAKINYCFLFGLYLIAESGKDRLKNIIEYKSLNDLSTKIKDKCGYSISISSISRILKDNRYLPYFSIDNNKIILCNNFKSGKAQSNSFVILTEREIYFLL